MAGREEEMTFGLVARAAFEPKLLAVGVAEDVDAALTTTVELAVFDDVLTFVSDELHRTTPIVVTAWTSRSGVTVVHRQVDGVHVHFLTGGEIHHLRADVQSTRFGEQRLRDDLKRIVAGVSVVACPQE